MKKRILFAIVAVAVLSACSAIRGAYEFTKCEYSYNSISGVKVAGIDFSNLASAMQPQNLAKITQIISGNFKDLPLEMTVNVNVKNPGQMAAAINDVEYQLAIDKIDIANGNLGKPFEVAAGKTNVLPVVIRTDLATLLNSENRCGVLQIVKNFTGISSDKSKISLKVRPLLKGKNGTVKLPQIPLSFSYGGKKSDSNTNTNSTFPGFGGFGK